MIEVSYLENDSIIMSLEVKGHANYDKYGSDIVCSAVSAVTIGGINAFDSINDININIEPGHVKIDGTGLQKYYNQVVVKTIVTQLLTIEKSYKQYIKISKKLERNGK